jgi:hypothetical protein
MSHELHYTSVPRGLKPGSRGFCTVGLTPHMPGPLVDRLEALSGYQPVFAPHDLSAALNPIVLSHLHLNVGGKVWGVLSRVGPAGLDYSGRPNKYAHHVVLEGTERPAGGPAWLVAQHGFLQTAWEGEPSEIPKGRIPPDGDRQPGVARAWQSLCGDGGWAGVLAEGFLADPRRTVFLIFQPGMDLLPLIIEALALVPASRRWDVDFSSYFSELPHGVTCAWRGVLEGSDQAKNALRLPNATVIDLCQAMGRAEGGALVHMARTGERLAAGAGSTTAPAGSGRHIPQANVEAKATSAESTRSVRPQPRGGTQSYELVPELARLVSGKARLAPSDNSGRGQLRPTRSWALPMILGAAGFVALALAGLFLGRANVTKLFANPDVAATRERVPVQMRNTEAKADEKAQTPTAETRTNIIVAAKPVLIVQQPPLPPKIKNDGDGSPPKSVGPLHLIPKKSDEPAVFFFSLPLIQESSLFHVEQQSAPLLLRSTSDKLDKFYYTDRFDIRRDGKSERFEVWTRSSGNYGILRVAVLKNVDGRLYFEWTSEAALTKNLAESLRDGVAKIKSKDGDDYYVLFRGLVTGEKELFLNSNAHPKLVNDDLRPRRLPLAWCDEHSLAGTKWPLGILQWKVTSQIGGGERRPIAAGGKSDPHQVVQAEIIRDESEIKLEIDAIGNDPHLIHVTIEFNRDQVIRRRRKMQRLFQLRSASNRTEQEENEMNTLFNSLNGIAGIGIDNVLKVESYLQPPAQGELSLVIGLKLDEFTILKLAKFGEFKAAQR